MKPEEVKTVDQMVAYIRQVTKEKRPEFTDSQIDQIVITITRTVKTPSNVAAFMEGFLDG